MIRLKKPLFAHILLLIGLLGGVGAGNYYRTLYLTELAGICLIVLFFLLAFTTRMRTGGFYLAFIPALGVACFVFLYAYVFSVRIGAPVLPSVLSQRDYVFFLLAPVIYMLHWRGWKLADFQRIFILAVLLTVGNYFIMYLTIDAEAWLRYGDSYQQSLVSYDELRGYRLRGPSFLVLFAALYFFRRALQSRRAFSFGFRLVMAALSIALLAINLPRSALFAVAVALIIYGVFLARARQVNLSLIVLPILVSLMVFAAPYLIDSFVTNFGQDLSYSTRIESAQAAWRFFVEYPVFGLGQDSVQSVSFQDLIGERFYPSDVGLLGVAFQFGLIGLFLYLFFSLWTFLNLLKLMWTYVGNAAPEQRTLVWALLIICLSFLIASPIQAKFIYGEGVSIGAFAWGLLLAYKHGLPERLRGQALRRHTKPVQDSNVAFRHRSNEIRWGAHR